MDEQESLLESISNSVLIELIQREPVTPEKVREAVAQTRSMPMFRGIDDSAAERIARRLESQHSISMDFGNVLEDGTFQKWLEVHRPQIDPYYWQRYEGHLARKSFSRGVVASIDRVTERTLGLLDNPERGGTWDRRGMVVGHVQSGKTANYLGLITKAADAGYRVIIVIAGTIEELRKQTQIRVDEGFVGKDSTQLGAGVGKNRVGVGIGDSKRQPVSFTSWKKDFNKGTATSVGVSMRDLTEPAVFVVKKNASTLKHLVEWMKEHSARGATPRIDVPMLLIDDEADNASINTSKNPEEATRINGQIRELLNVFTRSSYVGYTATPFANIFIDPDIDHSTRGRDLFPRNFIVSLDPPSNYLGPDKIFRDADAAIVRTIDDAEDLLPLRHKNHHPLSALPSSMYTAVKQFVLARAIRILRGNGTQHSAMLVNVSRFTSVHASIRNELHAFIRDMREEITTYGGLLPQQTLRYPIHRELQRLWQEEFADCGFSWEQVSTHLRDAILPIQVIEVHGRSSESLNYADYGDNGRHVIVVGGLSLSRGLTLEGLMISYLYRGTSMYDTLMQMGRWFGYRPGYIDLCRVWLSDETENWYRHISESMELLRSEIRQMERQGATPEEFGLRVRTHPDALMITARNKMGKSEERQVELSYSGMMPETVLLPWSPVDHKVNRDAAAVLVANIRGLGIAFSKHERGFLATGVPAHHILHFLRMFRGSELSNLTDLDLVIPYINDRLDELANWDVLFPSVISEKTNPVVDSSAGLDIRIQRRTAADRSQPNSIIAISTKQRIASRGIEKVGLTPEEVKVAEDEFAKKREGVKNISDLFYRRQRKRPLLVVHLIQVDQGTTPSSFDAQNPVVAWSISFPFTAKPPTPVTFRVNATWMNLDLNLPEAYEDDDDGLE